MCVGEDLHLDVVRALDQPFDVQCAVAERGLRFAPGRLDRRGAPRRAPGSARMPRPPPPADALMSAGNPTAFTADRIPASVWSSGSGRARPERRLPMPPAALRSSIPCARWLPRAGRRRRAPHRGRPLQSRRSPTETHTRDAPHPLPPSVPPRAAQRCSGSCPVPRAWADADGAVGSGDVRRTSRPRPNTPQRFRYPFAAGARDADRNFAAIRDQQAPDHAPLQPGLRFSRNARRPSWPSGDTRRFASADAVMARHLASSSGPDVRNQRLGRGDCLGPAGQHFAHDARLQRHRDLPDGRRRGPARSPARAGGEAAPGQKQFARSRPADLGEHERRDDGRDDAELHLGEAERRMFFGDDDVAYRRQPRAAAERGAVDAANHRHRQLRRWRRTCATRAVASSTFSASL